MDRSWPCFGCNEDKGAIMSEKSTRDLMKKYMTHVMHEEGISFVARATLDDIGPGGHNPVRFTSEELAALEQIEKEAEDEL